MMEHPVHLMFVITLASLLFNILLTPAMEVFAEIKKGSAGNDQIVGTGGRDNIRGLQGDDIIYGRGGNDFLFGNSGSDILYGDSGDDILSGDIGGPIKGADKFYCGPGLDMVLDFEPSQGDTQEDCEIINPH